MPYLLISTQVRLERGPTIVGDKWSDPHLMKELDAKMATLLGNDFTEYRTDDPPRVVLNKLSRMGYQVIGMTGIGQTCAWTLFKLGDDEEGEVGKQEQPSDGQEDGNTSAFSIDKGPTIIGDTQWMDAQVEQHLGTFRKKGFLGGPAQCQTKDPPRVVLDKLSQLGYTLVTMSSGGEFVSHVWTLYKADDASAPLPSSSTAIALSSEKPAKY